MLQARERLPGPLRTGSGTVLISGAAAVGMAKGEDPGVNGRSNLQVADPGPSSTRPGN